MANELRHTNRLAQETSPYLLQHAHNPVDWYPWGEAALGRARREDKPILLSIGYAACHWCHVMERESFENEAVAKVMNEHFVCIKVDREERPDLDDIYMAATVAMSGGGGWPMTVFLTPEQKPFFAGTYFPPEDRWGRPGFPSLLERIAELWQGERANLEQQAGAMLEQIQLGAETTAPLAMRRGWLSDAVRQLGLAFDPSFGGFGQAPKFPPSAALLLLMRHYHALGDPRILEMVTVTLDGMKNGGIYDHVGGGFARYSTDRQWLVPHFEKMLYDNAQLGRVYLEAFQLTENRDYERVVRETLDWVAGEMQSPEGGYYSATDADSEGVEGKFFVFQKAQIEAILEPEAARRFCAYYDITDSGNWEGNNVLNTPKSLDVVAKELGVPEAELEESLHQSRRKVYDAREQREHPLLDDKVLASWNALMIGTMAEAGRVLGSTRYIESAEQAARYLLSTLMTSSGALLRTARGGKAHLAAYLEDYAYLSDALVDLYEATGKAAWLEHARSLAQQLVEKFGDAEGGAFFHTAHNHEPLIVRMREGHDGALPNPGAVAARALLRLSRQLGNDDYAERARQALEAYGAQIERAPRAFATSLVVIDAMLEPALELVLVGHPTDADYQALSEVARRCYLPNRVLAQVDPAAPAQTTTPLTRGKGLVAAKASAYVCRGYQCERPTTSPGDLSELLERTKLELRQARTEQLEKSSIVGRATREGTDRYRQRQLEAGRHPSAYRRLGKSELWVSAFGFGSYRVSDRSHDHREALGRALAQGVNLVDTSSNYTDGHSERLVGQVLGQLIRAGTIQRDEIVIVSKLGYAQGTALELAASKERAGQGFEQMVKVRPDLWHCIHPAWLEQQLSASLARLGLETLDVCLLHNPEYFFQTARGPLSAQRDEFYARLARAFEQLEAEVRRGRIGCYGVSSNTVVKPADDPAATELERMLQVAEAAGGAQHHLRVLQLPLNLREAGALDHALALAHDRDLAVLTNRPLNCIEPSGLLRLSEPPELGSAIDPNALTAQLETIEELEREFRATLATMLEARGGGLAPEDLFRSAEELSEWAARNPTYESWQDFELGRFAPRLASIFQALDGAFRGQLAGDWQAWRDRYVAAVDGALSAQRGAAAERSQRRIAALSHVLKPLLSDRARALNLPQQAALGVASLRGVTSVLVGMRQAEYVEDFLAVLDEEPIAAAEAMLRAACAAEIPSR